MQMRTVYQQTGDEFAEQAVKRPGELGLAFQEQKSWPVSPTAGLLA